MWCISSFFVYLNHGITNNSCGYITPVFCRIYPLYFNTKRMNAQEARKIAFEKNVNAAESQYNEIKNKIHDAARKGNYFIWFYGDMNKDVKTLLSKEGFKIESNSYRNETDNHISW